MHIVLSDADSFDDRRVNRMMLSCSWRCQVEAHGPARTTPYIATGCPITPILLSLKQLAGRPQSPAD
jgi:hypothetical protein